MFWSEKQSVALTKCCIWLFIAGYVLVLFTCPFFVPVFVRLSYTAAGKDVRLFLASIYACAVPVGILLFHLRNLISAIGNEDIFTAENIKRLRLISWMCGIFCFLSMIYYLFWGILGCCLILMCLLIRVIKNVFARAKELKDENDFTI